MPRLTKARPKTKPKPKSIDTAARWLADIYCLWRFCGKRACRRGHACTGDVRACYPALSLVPPEARDFLIGFDEGQKEGLLFDEMMARNEEEWAAVEAWQELVMSTLPGGEA